MPLSNTSPTFFSPIAQHWILSCEYIPIMKCPFERCGFFCLFQLVCAVCVPVRTENVPSKCVFSGRSSLFSLNLRSFVHACLSCAYSQVGSEQQLSEGSGISHSEDIYVFKHPGHSCRVRMSNKVAQTLNSSTSDCSKHVHEVLHI